MLGLWLGLGTTLTLTLGLTLNPNSGPQISNGTLSVRVDPSLRQRRAGFRERRMGITGSNIKAIGYS